MIDGMKTQEMWVGSNFAETFSGVSLQVGTSIATAELEDSSVTSSKIAANNVLSGHILASNIVTAGIANSSVTLAKIANNAIDADTNTLSSGSRWVAFRTAFAAPPFVAATLLTNTRTAALAVDGDWLGVGSIAPGSFLAVGSPGGYNFNWVAIGSR